MSYKRIPWYNSGMEPETVQKLEELDRKVSAIFDSVEKTRKYFLVTMWITVILFVVPLVLMVFVIPFFLNTYLGALDGLI